MKDLGNIFKSSVASSQIKILMVCIICGGENWTLKKEPGQGLEGSE